MKKFKKIVTSALIALSLTSLGSVAFASATPAFTINSGETEITSLATDVSRTYQLPDGSYRLEIRALPNKIGTAKKPKEGLHITATYTRTIDGAYFVNLVEFPELTTQGSGLQNNANYMIETRPNVSLPDNIDIRKIEFNFYPSTISPNTSNLYVYEMADTWNQATLMHLNKPAYYSNERAIVKLQGNNIKHTVDVTKVQNNWIEWGQEWPGFMLFSTTQTKIYSPQHSNTAYHPYFNVYYTGGTVKPTEKHSVNVNLSDTFSPYEVIITGEIKGNFADGSNQLNATNKATQNLIIVIKNTQTGEVETKGIEAVQDIRVNIVNDQITGFRIYGPAKTTNGVGGVYYTLQTGTPKVYE